MKHLAFLIIAILFLSSEVLAEWRYLGMVGGLAYQHNPEVIVAYPIVLVDARFIPADIAAFRKAHAPGRPLVTAAGFVVSLNCSTRGYKIRGGLLGYDSYGGTRPLAAAVPGDVGANEAGALLVGKYCRLGSSPSGPRWQFVSAAGKGFKEFGAFLNTQSVRRNSIGGISFWWRIYPHLPIMYAYASGLPASFIDKHRFGYALNYSTVYCNDRRLLNESVSFYTTDEVFMEDGEGSGVENVEPESFGENLLRFVCSQTAKP